MTLLRSESILNHIGSIIHQETQEHKDHFDLTVNQIFEFTEAGSLDFGGSEFKGTEKRSLESQKKNEEDNYGWWHLRKGCYQARMNEELSGLTDTLAIITLHEHAHQAGIIANTRLLSGIKEPQPITINFQVSEAGCNIKENARMGSIYLLST